MQEDIGTFYDRRGGSITLVAADFVIRSVYGAAFAGHGRRQMLQLLAAGYDTVIFYLNSLDDNVNNGCGNVDRNGRSC